MLTIKNSDIAKHLSLPPVKLHCSMVRILCLAYSIWVQVTLQCSCCAEQSLHGDHTSCWGYMSLTFASFLLQLAEDAIKVRAPIRIDLPLN